MVDFIIILLLAYLIYSTESNAKIIVKNQKEIAKSIDYIINNKKD